MALLLEFVEPVDYHHNVVHRHHEEQTELLLTVAEGWHTKQDEPKARRPLTQFHRVRSIESAAYSAHVHALANQQK